MAFTMFSGFSITVLLLLLLVISITTSISNLASWAQVNKDIIASDVESAQFVIYENSTFGIRIEFPKQWEFEVPDNISENPLRVVYFYNNPDDLFGDFVIEIEKLGSPDNIGDYVANTIKQYRQNDDEFKLLTMSMNNKLGGLQAYSILYSERYNSTSTLKTLEVGTIRGSQVYFIQYYAFADQFDRNLPIAKKMINSIEFINAGYGKSFTSYGPVNSDHQHATFAVVLNNSTIDFSQEKYQLQIPLIHVENGDGKTIHRHASNIPFLHFLNSLGMNIISDCFILDNGTKHCSNDNVKLKFFLNGNQVNSISNYVIGQGDEILVIYGNDLPGKINSRLVMLNPSIKPLFPH
jgi:hypothetical protein